MKSTMTNLAFIAFAIVILGLNSCSKEKYVITIKPSDNADTELQEAMIEVESGWEIRLEEGTYNFSNTLSIDGKDSVKIIGAGRDKTILNFSGQLAGGEGVYASNCNGILFKDLTVQDAQGDALKAKDCNYISFVNVGTVWSGEPSSSNGAYGLYPVLCNYVFIDNCYAYGASDAGIYVGQSEQIILRNSVAQGNVAGIEIENSTAADVYNNESFDNTGGILIFDLPNLTKYGHQCRVYNNNVHDNNRDNFAPAGNIVGTVPSGTGIMILATYDVEIYNNMLDLNNFANIVMTSYDFIDSNHGDPNFFSFYYNIDVHDNTYSIDSLGMNTTGQPAIALDLAGLLQSYGYAQPDIIMDGAFLPSVCIQDTTVSLVNLDAPSDPSNFSGINDDLTPFDCSPAGLPAVSFSPFCATL